MSRLGSGGNHCITNLPKTVAKNNCNWLSSLHSFCGSRIQEGLSLQGSFVLWLLPVRDRWWLALEG